jgi:hypothetical protein
MKKTWKQAQIRITEFLRLKKCKVFARRGLKTLHFGLTDRETYA